MEKDGNENDGIGKEEKKLSKGKKVEEILKKKVVGKERKLNEGLKIGRG